MANDVFSIRVEEQELPELYSSLEQLEVELDDELAGAFRLRLKMERRDSSWSHLDDRQIGVWKRVQISGGVEDEQEELITGYITQLKPRFGASDSGVFLDVWGLDATVLMDRSDVFKSWPNKKHSDIATELFDKYGLTPDVENTELVHDQALGTILQRESDIQFLKRLALLNGYECYVRGTSGVFRSPSTDAPPKPVLAAHFGPDTTISNLTITLDACAPTDVLVAQIGRHDKQVYSVAAVTSAQPLFGAEDSSALLSPIVTPAQRAIGPNGALAPSELERMAHGLRARADWFVEVQGDVDGLAYGHVLRPRDSLFLKGVGETYSGRYYVARVVHVFAPGGYTQRVQLRRNALRPIGDEQFEPETSMLGGLP